eukprot:COSAG01_NODE_3831_length_5651_cov_4.363112_1_plen_41_part_10
MHPLHYKICTCVVAVDMIRAQCIPEYCDYSTYKICLAAGMW